MTDVGKHHFIKSQEHSTLVLVPQPSQDPHDPLNWSPLWKASVSFAVSSMTFTQGFAPLALAPMFPYLIRDYESSLEAVIQFTGVTILILGFSNFIWSVLVFCRMASLSDPKLQGSHLVILWPAPRLHRLPAHLPRFPYSARQG